MVFPDEIFVGGQALISCAIVQKNDVGAAGNEPASEMAGDARIAQFVQSLANEAFGGAFFEFEGGGGWVVWADEKIPIAPAFEHCRDFGAKNGVDAAELPADLPAAFKEQGGLVGRPGWWRGRGGGRIICGYARFPPAHGGIMCEPAVVFQRTKAEQAL